MPLLKTRLKSYWALDEASGTRVDKHGTANLTPVNAPGNTTGLVYATALDNVNASGQNLFYNDTTGLYAFGNTDFTIAAWVKATSLIDNMTIIGRGNFDTGDRDFIVYYSTGLFGFNTYEAAGGGGGHGCSADEPVFTGVWYLVISEWDTTADRIRQSVNADLTNEGFSATGGSGIYASGSQELSVGLMNGVEGTNWDGVLGPIMIWNRLLTAAEKTKLYRDGKGLQYEAFPKFLLVH